MIKFQNIGDTYKLSLFFLFIWLPFYLAFFPGVGMHDEIYVSIHPKSATQPFMYNIGLSLFYKIGFLFNSQIAGTGLFIFILMCATAIAIASIIVWLHKKGVHKYICYILILYYAFTPIIIDYSISAVKDRAFAVILLLMIPVFYQLATGNFIINNSFSLNAYCALALLMIWFRNNGAYVFLVITLICLVIMKVDKKKFIKYSVFVLLIGLLPSLIIGGDFTEAAGIPLQQVCRVVALNRDLPEKEKNYINGVIPIENIKKQYQPESVDAIKWSPAYNRSYVNTHKLDFIKTWFTLFTLYPNDYLNAWLINTKGFWGYLPWLDSQSKFGHAYEPEIYLAENKVGMADGFKVSQSSVLPNSVKQALGKYIWDYSIFIPSGICFWITIVIGSILYFQKKRYLIFVILPALLCSLTLILAAPIANCFRYTFYYALCLPIYLLLPFIHQNDKTHNDIT